MEALPIDEVLGDLTRALAEAGMAILAAPPGAGKSTRVPLALLEAGLTDGKIFMLEPRRLAARATAERMAATLGEKVGQQVGYRIRGEAKVGRETRIEVLTEGILTRMIQSDPELAGIGAVIFDEIHERSLNADLGLALTLDLRAALRPDLLVLAMSATLDTALFSKAMDGAAVVVSEGRSFRVETRWRQRPLPRGARLEGAVVDTLRAALRDTEGGVLVFLPGEGEIRRVAAALASDLPDGVRLRPLYGAMPFAEQRAAIRPEIEGRKVVLATAIAETSLTIEDIRVVIDGGRARRARFDPGSGMTRLVTEKVSRAEADQRAGRAGRVAPGIAYRLWTKGEEGALAPYPPADIETADLAGFALDLAVWGARSPEDVTLLTPPPRRAFDEARALLADLGALDAKGAVTDHGKRIAGRPTHPRLAHMLEVTGRAAAPLAALLGDRDPLRDRGVDLTLRLRALDAANEPGLKRISAEAKRLSRRLDAGAELSTGAMLALAYPDRIGRRRPGDVPRYLLSSGSGAMLDPGDDLANAKFLVVADTDGARPEARIRLAAEIGEAELRALFADRIREETICAWSDRQGKVVAQRRAMLGEIALAEAPWPDPPEEEVSRAMLDGILGRGLAFRGRAAALLTRAQIAKEAGAEFPAVDHETLVAEAKTWLLPHLVGIRSLAQWDQFDPSEALKLRIGWAGLQEIDRIAPPRWTTPLGRQVEVDYTGDVPGIAVRLQELFGLAKHPVVGGRPLRLTLLSPAGRPVQVTQDLEGFWANSYGDVRKDMRGRYPKHPWPEDPRAAQPTLRTKAKGG
ncbi:MAG: ATP-dependent helicase HrpB [Pseudomonadota bacterium]